MASTLLNGGRLTDHHHQSEYTCNDTSICILPHTGYIALSVSCSYLALAHSTWIFHATLGGLVDKRAFLLESRALHGSKSQKVVNPRRACAARVTVVVLCVCLSTTILALQATRRLMSDTNSFSGTWARKIKWRFC